MTRNSYTGKKKSELREEARQLREENLLLLKSAGTVMPFPPAWIVLF